MIECPVVILVGGQSTGKTRFYSEFTHSEYSRPTDRIHTNFVVYEGSVFILVDTPGNPNLRSSLDYSWSNVFQYVDVIVNFGYWSESEVYDTKTTSPKIITWSGDNQETMKRLHEYLQGR